MTAIKPQPAPPKPQSQASPSRKLAPKKRGVFEKLFRNIALFFTRLSLWFDNKVWYSDIKIKQMISETKDPKPNHKISLYTSQIEKVVQLLNRLSRWKDLDLEEEEFRSLIDEKAPGFQLLDKMSTAGTRLLFQIQADEFGANNENLEGYNKKETLAYLSEYFNAREKAKLDLYGLPNSVIEEISTAAKIAQATDLQSFIHLTKEAIQKSPGQPILLPGGWSGSPSGHAMFYEVIPQQSGKVTLRLFNLGAGSNGAIDPTDYKTKAVPYIDFEGVAREKLTDTHVLQAIYELNNFAFYPNEKTKTQFGEEDIYEGLKSLLNPESISQPEGPLKTTQRSGICSWRSLMAFLSSRMSKAEYKRFACDIKMQSLLHRDWKNITDKSEINLLQKSHEKIARKLNKLVKEKFIGMRYLARANELLGIVGSYLKDHKIKAYKSSSGLFHVPSTWSATDANFAEVGTPLHLQANEVHQEDAPALHTSLIDSICSYPLAKAISESRKLIAKREFHTAHIALQKYITALNLDSLEQNSLEELTLQLGEVAKLYFDTCFLIPEADVVLPERVIALEKMLVLQTKIAKSLCPESGKYQFYANQNSFLFNPNNDQSGCPDQRKTGLLSAASQQYGRNCFVANDSDIEKSAGKFRIKFAEGSNLDRLFPNHEELFAGDPEYYTLQREAQMAKFYMSDKTPVWFQMLRNTSLLTHYLSHEPVANPSRGSTSSFNLNLLYEKDRNFSDTFNVVVSIKEASDDILKKCPREKGYHFASTYRPFHSAQMKKFIAFMVEKNHRLDWNRKFSIDEKELLSIDPNKDFPEQSKELEHIFTKSNKIAEGLEYFYRHPEKLADPDYQTLFEIFLFNEGYLKEELGKSGFSTLLNNFLKEQIKHSLTANEVQKGTFLIRMSRLIHTYDERVESQTDALKILLNQNQHNSTEKSVIYAELVAAYGKQEDLNKHEVGDLIVWSAFLMEYPVPQKWIIPQQNNEVREALILQNKRIRKVLLKDQAGNILNRAAKEVYGIERSDPWEVVDDGKSIWFRTCDKKTSYNPTHAKLVSENYEVSLPRDLVQHPFFAQNFKGVSSAVHRSNNVYSFIDEGKQTLVKAVNGEVLIEQQRGGNWFRFVPEETFRSTDPFDIASKRPTHLGSRHLLQNYSHWQNIADPTQLILIDLKTGRHSYNVTLENNDVQQVSKIGSSHLLMHPSELLTRFEDSTYVQEWGGLYSKVDQIKLSRVDQIELPRFGLSFTRDATKKNQKKSGHSKVEFVPEEQVQWNCDQFSKDGYFLAQDQSLPIMGSYKNYLVLENAAGKKKALLPEYKIKPPKHMNAILPGFYVDQNLESINREPQKYSTFDVNKDGLLESKSIVSKYYLSLVLSAVQEYDSAAQYLLKFGSKLTRYTAKEQASLSSIAKMGAITGDESGNGLALQTYALYLLTRNALEHDVDLSKEKSEPQIGVYKNYLAHLNNATALKLTKEEELFLLKFFLNKTYDPVLHLRLQKLDPQFAREIKIPKKPAFDDYSKHLAQDLKDLLEDLKLPNSYSQKKLVPFENMLLTRINTYLEKNPIEMFEIITKATVEQKIWFKEAFTFGKKSSLWGHWSVVFENIMNHPEQYNSPPVVKGFSKDKKLKKWWEEVKKTAEKNMAEEREQPAAAPLLKKPEIHANELEPQAPDVEVKVELKKVNEVPSFSERAKPHITTRSSKSNSRSYEKWLADELANPTSSESLYTNEIKRLQNDMLFQKEKVHYTIKNLGQIKKILRVLNREKNQEKLKKLEIELMALANRPAESYFDQLFEKTQLRGKTRKALTLDDLIFSFAKKDPAALIRENPNLKPVIDELYKKIGLYLIISTREQQRTRALETLSKLEKAKGADRKELEQQLAAEVLAARAYKPHENPAYLAFEYYANLIMREQQVEKLKSYLEGGDVSQVEEMIMGSGKSKILLPLLGLLRANGKKLSMVIVPQPLFESISSDTQRVLSEAFSHPLKSLHFHRNTKFDKYTLQRIKDDLLEITNKKECLIITSKSIQCFLLKFVEESIKQKGTLTDELLLMRDILNMLAPSHPLIDEVDTVLNVLHEVSFSTGAEVKPRDNEIQLIAEIYHILYTDPTISKLVHIESNPNANNAEEELSEKNYHKKVKPLLAEKLLENFNANDKALALNYLLRGDVSKQDQASAQAYYHMQGPEEQNFLALAAEQLNNFLPHTLTKTCKEKYGLDSKDAGNIAIPYAAANAPNTGSQFANHYITMNYTFQYYMKKGIKKKILIKEIERLQSMAMHEMKEKGAECSREMTEGWRLFKNISEDLEIPLFNFNDTQLTQLLDKINGRVDLKMNFIQKVILPQLKLSGKKLSCNPQNLIAFFLFVSGFTGTLWNQHSMHSKIKAMPDPGIDSKTLNILWNMSNEKVEVLNGTSPTDIIEELIAKGIKYDLISDSGGYLKEGGNTKIALELSLKLGKPAVFYNKDNQQAIIENGKEVLLTESTTPVDQRCAFLDQSHTTGSDVAYKQDAVGLVTISRNMLLRDLLQSVWRLRGLDKSQKVKFIISKEVQGIICQVLGKDKDSEISLGDILRFTIINQTKQQGIDNFKGLRQEMYSQIQQLLFTVMLSPDYTNAQRKDTVQALEKFWIKDTTQEPRKLFGDPAVEEDSAVVVANELKKFKETIEKLRVKLPHLVDELAPMQKTVEEHAESLKHLLPNKLVTPIRDLDHDQTSEVLDETEQESQTQLEVNNHQQSEKIELGRKIDLLLHPKKQRSLDEEMFENSWNYFFDLKTYFDLDKDLKEYSEAFSGVSLTLNMLQWDKDKPKIEDLKFFGSNRTPIHQIQLKYGEALLKSTYETESYENPEVYNLGFGFYDPMQKLTDEQKKLIVKIKFLNAESSYSKAEETILGRWIEKQGVEKMHRLLHNHILAGMPDKITDFNSDSTLKRVFDSLKTC